MQSLVITMVVAAVITAIIMVLVAKKKNLERYIMYPFGPIDPKKNKFPLDAQAVFGYPAKYFQLCSGPNNCGQGDTFGGAIKPLQTIEKRALWNGLMNKKEWQTNVGFNNTGNTTWALKLGEKPFNAWANL